MGLHGLITRLFPTTHSKEMDERLLAEQLKRTKLADKLVKPTSQEPGAEVAPGEEPPVVVKKKLSMREVGVFLVKSPHIRCASPHQCSGQSDERTPLAASPNPLSRGLSQRLSSLRSVLTGETDSRFLTDPFMVGPILL